MAATKHFKVTRSVTMRFVQVLCVEAESEEEVIPLTAEFLETDWSPEAQAQLGVTVISEEGEPVAEAGVDLHIVSIPGPLTPDLGTASRLATDILISSLDSVKH